MYILRNGVNSRHGVVRILLKKVIVFIFLKDRIYYWILVHLN